MIFSGFRYTHGGRGDARLVNYTLEHGFRWISQTSPHQNFWNPPIFYPYPNVTSFTDFMLGVGPLFWIWRSLGASPDTAFQYWILLVYACNFAAAYLLLRLGTGVGVLASTAGALLLASMMVRWLSHPQLFPMFCVLLALLALLRIFVDQHAPGMHFRRRVWIGLFFSTGVVQAWSAIYPFFFFGFLCGIALLSALLLPDSRKRLIRGVRGDMWWWLLCAALSAVALFPLVHHYGITASNLGFRNYSAANVSQPLSWILLGKGHWLYGSTQSRLGPLTSPLFSLGIGPLTLACSAWGLYQWRQRLLVKVIGMATVVMVLLATTYGPFSPWMIVHYTVPGAGAIRAFYRVTMILIPIAVIGFAIACHRKVRKQGWWMLAILIMAGIGEQARPMGYIDKDSIRQHVAAIAKQVDPGYQAFFLVGTHPEGAWVAEDAAWSSLLSGVPTINGRYGNFPKGYELRNPLLKSPEDDQGRDQLDQALRRWLRANGMERQQVQWIEYEPLRRTTPKQSRRQRRKNRLPVY